ncbi:hypothetical protein Poli38472_008225 [Pythium oligandrum]|uniref:Uncharacterized protein n=1 Tax=Pythium oligandrum TaxID=41045 RepID=A0A8K1CME6_PYTOL|nr:hypothetical protein Poli38472_008225 [Pythium oligandrum]|eukprot:TMW65583.1 hypothetical protein Poli38472_008225 [Pythium oligandrum]
MIGRQPTAARTLFGFTNSDRFARFQQSVQNRFEQLTTATIASAHGSIPPPPGSVSCALQSTFASSNGGKLVREDSKTSTKAEAENSDLVLIGIDGISLHIASFLDGQSLGRMQLVNRSWHQFVSQHRDGLLQALLDRCFETVITSSNTFKTFLFTLRHELDLELAHTRYIEHTHAALEDYCSKTEPTNHGFIAMFCDIIRFRDPRIARFVAHRRQAALGMVLTSTPDHVYAFRRRCKYAGPITFVPVDNPHWPEFDLPPVNFPGFLGYAFEHVEMVKGYESLKYTVVKSILKELMLFDTTENAEAYGRAIGREPFAAVLDAEHTGPNYHLTFSNPLREELRHLPVRERVQRLLKRIEAIDHSISRCSY